MSEIEIQSLSEELIDGVMEISDAEFGLRYKSAEHFVRDIGDPDVNVSVATIGGRVVGFGRSVRFGPEGVDRILMLPDSAERDYLLTKNTIVLFDSLAIKGSEQGKGIGTKLYPAVMEAFPYDVAVVMAWKNCEDGHINVHKLLVNKGFRQTALEVEGYFGRIADNPDDYLCPVCGHPDRCSGVLYIRESR